MNNTLPKVVKIPKIGFQNVVSKRETFEYPKIEEFYKDFISEIIDSGYHPKGPYFYSLNNVPENDIVDIEMFLLILENSLDLEGFKFYSYVELNNLVKTIVAGDFKHNTEIAYAELLATLEINNWEIATPFYHVVPTNGSKYINLYLGYY